MKAIKGFERTGIFLYLLLSMIGCGGGAPKNSVPPPVPPTPPVPAASVFVAESSAFPYTTPSSILEYSSAVGASASPISTITGPPSYGFTALTLDATGNIYVVAQTGANGVGVTGTEVLEYAKGAQGAATPVRTIAIPLTTFQLNGYPITYPITSIAIDPAGNLYLGTMVNIAGDGNCFTSCPGGGIEVFSVTASGNATLVRTIGGPNTGIDGLGVLTLESDYSPDQIAIDSAANIYTDSVSEGYACGSVLAFGPTATGNVAPDTTLAGALTNICQIDGLALDSVGNLYVAAAEFLPGGNPLNPTSTPGYILEFKAGSAGNVAPIRTIGGSATEMETLGNLTVDSAGNIYVLNSPGIGGENILEFGPSATGNVAPIAIIGTLNPTSTNYLSSVAVN